MSDVEQALASYMTAFEHFQTDAVLSHYAYPCHFTSDGDEVALMPLAEPAECRPRIERVMDWHRQLGADHSRIERRARTDLSPKLTCLTIRVEVLDRQRRFLYDFDGIYTFAHTREGWRIAAIAHNQIPRLLARLQG